MNHSAFRKESLSDPRVRTERLDRLRCACERNADMAVNKLVLKLFLGGELKVQRIFVLYMFNTRTKY